MRWRLVVVLAGIGIALLIWGGMEWRLGRGASSAPERISLVKLIARGPEGNPNIILTDFELVPGDYVILEEHGSWHGVYVPVVPAGQVVPAAAPGGRPPVAIKAVLFSLNIHSDAEIGPVLAKRELPAMVTNRINSLNSEEANLLRQSYGGNIDVDHCLIIQEGRKPMNGALLALIFGGGVLLLVGSVGVVVVSIMADYKRTGPRPKRRRSEGDRPRKRRRVEDEKDNDEPRPKRRRPRNEDEP